MKREAKKNSLPSITATYQHGARVLAAMSQEQIPALKKRVRAA
jgi:hypothetical protein